MSNILCVLLVLFSFSCRGWAQDEEPQEMDFNAIKDVIENDKLTPTVKKKKKVSKEKKKAYVVRRRKRHLIPSKNDFWSFFTEYWLVKNAPVLKWDFKKPDYGINQAFAELLEDVGYFEKKFKILFLNTPTVTHFALPSDPNETILLLSVPFIRKLDLSKKEIALLLLEDFVRRRLGIFKDFVANDKVNKILGTTFYNKKLDLSIFDEMLERYDTKVFDKGFTFQEQFEVTQKMNNLLKSNLTLWNYYYKMISKIDDLVKTDSLYKDYVKIYPSPEMQMNWLKPVE